MGKENIYNNLINNITIEKFKEIDKKRENRINIIYTVLTVLICTFSATTMVFAKDISIKIYENYFNTGNGVGAAIENGYIEENLKEHEEVISRAYAKNEYTGKVINTDGTKIKVDKLMMDDFNLSVTLDVELSEDLEGVINLKEVKDMSMPDLIIYDENSILLLHQDNYSIKDFCERNSLNFDEYDILKDAPKTVNCGFNAYTAEKNGNHIKMLFNIYTGKDVFPKSKKLSFYLTDIRLSESVETMHGEEEVSLKGIWEFSIDVPEKMYNRTKIKYEEIFSTNKEFKVTSAYLYETGMNIEAEFPVGKDFKEEKITIPEIEFWESLSQDDDLKDINILNYYYATKLENNEKYREASSKSYEKWQYDKYLINENNEKYNLSMGPRENGGSYVTEDGIMKFTGMFDLTKYDATDEVIMHIDYHGNIADITLKKVGEE